MTVESLARQVDMASTFHYHFRAVTSMALQCQKVLRLRRHAA